jgi:hypothetical protein
LRVLSRLFLAFHLCFFSAAFSSLVFISTFTRIAASFLLSDVGPCKEKERQKTKIKRREKKSED